MVTMLDFESGSVIARAPVGIGPEGLAVATGRKTVVDVSESTGAASVRNARNATAPLISL